MKDFNTWLQEHEIPSHLKPSKPDTKNKEGGYEPDTPERKKMFKKVDLITLPPGVPGTNCSNCKFNHDGFCDHEDIMDWVTPRMCCKFWDNDGVKRSWGKSQVD